MPDLSNHPSANVTKLLLMGDPGSGKTGSLASLADAGYNLRILDLDNGLDVLRNVLDDPKSPYDKAAISRVKYITLTERIAKITNQGGVGVPPSATVWNRLVQALSTNPDFTNLTEKDVLVLDSLTLAGMAAFNFAHTQNPSAKDNRQIYGQAQNYIEYLMQCFYAEDMKCNVIVNSHITFIEDGTQVTHGYPTTIGRALSFKVGRYFNSVLMMRSEGKNHRLHTVPSSRVELKSSAPLRVKEFYDIKFGLAEYFRDVRGNNNSPPNSPSMQRA